MGILKKLIIAPLVLVTIYVVTVFVLAFPEPQRFMIFLNRIQLPTQLELPEWYGFSHNKIRNVRIQTVDNITLGAWHILPSSYYSEHHLRDMDEDQLDLTLYDKALMDPRHETLIYFHGNSMNRAAPWRVELYKRLSDKFDRLNIIAIDYRGYGDSEGVPSEEGLHLDAMAVVDWLRERKVPHHRISLIGHSLGTGVATSLAYEMTRAGQPPKALIVKAAFSSLPNLIFEYHVLDYLPILAPLRALPRIQAWLLGSLQHIFDSQSRMEHIECPILIVYGASDLEIPGYHSQMLFHRAIYGTNTSDDAFSREWMEHDPTIKSYTVPKEAVVYSKGKTRLVKILYAGHNNLGYFEYVFQAMAETAGWHKAGQKTIQMGNFFQW